MTDNQQEQKNIAVIRKERLDALRAAGEDPFVITTYDKTHGAREIVENFDKLEGQHVKVAGRVVQKRVMGKMSFFNIIDNDGRIQVVVKRDEIDPEEPHEKYLKIKKLDIFDIVGVEGTVFRTEAGEISVRAEDIVLLSKSLLPPPGKALEEFGAMTDENLKYRQRYVDLIMNPEVKKVFFMRSAIIRYIREYMDNSGFIEVETPVLNTQAGGAAARPFVTHHNTLDIDMYLRIATELHLKRLIVGGFERVYEIGRIFRNEGMDTRHNPEFTSIEMYQAYTDMHGMMDLAENLFVYVAEKLFGKGNTDINYQGETIHLKKPWDRMTMNEAVLKYTGVDFASSGSADDAKELARGLKLEVSDGDTRGSLLAKAFDEYVEDKLIQPTFIYEYPVEVSPLAKRKASEPWLTERFELFCTRRELANAFSELNDPEDQRARFEAQVKMREAGDDEAHVMDEDFINALSYGMPPTGGMGIGIDRMVMLFTNQSSIRDVLLFPTMKSLDGQKSANDSKTELVESAPEAAPVEEEKIDFSNVVIEPLFEDSVDFETFSKSDFRAVKVLACEAVKKSKKLLQFTLDDGTGTNRTILSGIHAFYEPEELVGKTLIAITNLPPRPMMGIESCGMLLSAINKRGEEEELHLLMVDNHIPAGAKLY